MADPALFGHDRLAHLLSDRLLGVPNFQRGYAWETINVQEFLEDLRIAREEDQPYFMGTVVLAEDPNDPSRQIIVDGQQRLITTAILIAAIRDRLNEFGKSDAVIKIDKDYLNTFDLDKEDTVIRLRPNPEDLPTYENILRSEPIGNRRHPLAESYGLCVSHLQEVAPTLKNYRALISIVSHLEKNVQVLLAVASGLPEAYIIFETLNDRGADLTTADLLKNYLFSQSKDYIRHVEQKWTRISAAFDKSDDLVKFIRYDHSARVGKVTTRKLYKALQNSVGRGSRPVRDYVNRLEGNLELYSALRDPDSDFWGKTNVDVRDSLLAFRRFGFESSMPLLLASLTTWDVARAAKLVNKIASWSVRAWFAGRLGGGTAEEVFCEAAVGISDGGIKSQNDVLEVIKRIVPDDQTFRRAFLSYGYVSTGRAKYLLSQLERHYLLDRGENAEAQPDWSGRSVSVEHIFAESSGRGKFNSQQDYERFLTIVNSIANFTLLERTLNRGLGDAPFSNKAASYGKSKFHLTRELGQVTKWDLAEADARAGRLADLAVHAWPSS
jgi:hypothetical protein